jgi:hypothetical protein
MSIVEIFIAAVALQRLYIIFCKNCNGNTLNYILTYLHIIDTLTEFVRLEVNNGLIIKL